MMSLDLLNLDYYFNLTTDVFWPKIELLTPFEFSTDTYQFVNASTEETFLSNLRFLAGGGGSGGGGSSG